MGALKSKQQETFVQGIMSGLSQRKAYRAAYPTSVKWPDETVDSKASTLFSNEKVVVRYNELQSASVTKSIMDHDAKQKVLINIIDDKDTNQKYRMRAIDILNKMDGDYIEKREISGGMTVNNPYQNLTTEQLQKLADTI